MIYAKGCLKSSFNGLFMDSHTGRDVPKNTIHARTVFAVKLRMMYQQ